TPRSSHYLYYPTAAHRHLPSFLHDALPISAAGRHQPLDVGDHPSEPGADADPLVGLGRGPVDRDVDLPEPAGDAPLGAARAHQRSEEHTSELQSPYDLVCRLLLEKKKKERP